MTPEREDDDRLKFSYSPGTFPYHSDCYTWPRVGVGWGDDTVVLHVHLLRDMKRKQFSLMGFIDVPREDQISAVIFMAQMMSAKVIAFEGAGLNDEIISTLMATMVVVNPEKPGEKTSIITTDWPTRFQRKILREAADMCRHGDFHETSLAYRMNAPVEEIRQHLQLMADIGLMKEAD